MRCSGHTSRMLREAIILVLTGKTVAIVMATEYLAHDAARRTREIVKRLGVATMHRWSWQRIQFVGLRSYNKMRDIWEKDENDVIVMGDPGLSDIERRVGFGKMLTPDEWPV